MATGDAMSNYLENKLQDHVLGGPDYARPATVYVALFTADPGETGATGEVSGGSYARAAVTNNSTNWPAASGGVKSNGTTITFPTATASWGTITHMAIFDAATAGNMLYHGALSASKTVGNGDTFDFPAGNISITFD